jgi:hypothetical protein
MQKVVEDVSVFKCPEIPDSWKASLTSRTPSPKSPVTRAQTAAWVDRLRDSERVKIAASKRLLSTYASCKKPI